jgi:hypothetical protein
MGRATADVPAIVQRSMMQPPSSFIIDTVMGSRDRRITSEDRLGASTISRCCCRIATECLFLLRNYTFEFTLVLSRP